MDIKFHCESKYLFPNEKKLVRGFVYKNYSIEPHNHDFYEMNIILNGTGIHNIENSGFRVSSGDVFIIPPLTVHSYCDTENLDVYHLLMHRKFIEMNYEEATKVGGFLQLTEIEPFLRKNYSGAMFLHLSVQNLIHLENDLRYIEDGGEFNDSSYHALKYHTTWKILYWLSYLLNKQINSQLSVKKNNHRHEIVSILDFIHHNYHKKLTIDILAKNAYMSRSTFLRSFSEVCGCTPITYLTGYRCKKARELLNEKHLSKTEIAHRCGFYDLSHMEKFLKTGIIL